jgi:hypothetical protein
VPRGGRGKSGEGAGRVRRRVGRHGTGVVASGRASVAGALRTGEATGVSDAGAAAEKWGQATSGPVASGSVRKGEERMRQRRCSFKLIQTSSNGFKFAQILLIQKVPSLALKFGNKIWLERA